MKIRYILYNHYLHKIDNLFIKITNLLIFKTIKFIHNIKFYNNFKINKSILYII